MAGEPPLCVISIPLTQEKLAEEPPTQPLCNVVGVFCLLNYDKMKFLNFVDMYLIVSTKFSQHLVTHGPPDPPPIVPTSYTTPIKFSPKSGCWQMIVFSNMSLHI